MVDDSRVTLKKPWQIYSVIGMVSVVMLAAMLLLSMGGWRMSQHHVPLVHAVHEMKVQIALFHLWFEELVQGDETVKEAEVWSYLDRSEAHGRSMLYGAVEQGYEIKPLQDPRLLEDIRQAIVSIDDLRAIGKKRLAESETSAGGSAIDQEFDTAFTRATRLAEEVEVAMQSAIAENVREFQIVAYVLVFMMVAVSFGVAYMVYRYEGRRKQADEQIHALAFHDALTGLPNRSLLHDRLDLAIANCRRTRSYGALLFLDLDKFKPLNDTYGHDAGDLLLKEVARRITLCVREVDTVARFGGDEFVVVIDELSMSKEAATAQAGIVAQKICAVLAEPCRLKIGRATGATIDYQCTTSCGVVVFADQKVSGDDLLKWADMAMYEAKNAGSNRFVFYEPVSG